ncbi:hypothetical protein ACFYNY_20130 [Streptomyces sp. NPDC006530]|uniref:hypothetical protein n=1 Tax=Streptomyces sp. NPDC006530 TaxID=3364750 RepID=UPI00369D1A65
MGAQHADIDELVEVEGGEFARYADARRRLVASDGSAGAADEREHLPPASLAERADGIDRGVGCDASERALQYASPRGV